MNLQENIRRILREEETPKYDDGGSSVYEKEKPYQVYSPITQNVEGYFENKKEAEQFAEKFEDSIVYDIREEEKVGKEFWFEYHCFESDESCDAEIWYRSHQKVKVVDVAHWSLDDKEFRYEDGQFRVYIVEWKDGFRYDIFEDELMESPDEFYRPDPPKRINETYSSNIEQIKEFLSELEFPIILYRGLLLEKGEKINKKKLGTHWSLDEFFVRNLFYYNTFGGNREQVSDDYNFYVITAEFNKNDIDFEGTIQKRLIKDEGHFWDELTGELIQNPKMEFHPYSHEEEILAKSTSNPKIINIEKIDIYNIMNLQENIRKVLREETSKNDIFKQVLRMGFHDSYELFGSFENLFNVLGVKNEVDFMNLFKGLEKHETEGYYYIHLSDDNEDVEYLEDINTDLVLYRFEKGNNIFIYHDGFITVKCEIIQILSHFFDMSVSERYMFLKEWIKKNYNLDFTHLFSTCGSEELESIV